MNNIESGIVKVAMWAFGVMFTALFTMVTLTYQSQIRTENAFRDHYYQQTDINQYTIRRLAQDSISIIALKNQVFIIQYWVKNIRPESFKNDPATQRKIEVVLKEEETNANPDLR